jgi:hypothetical protein
MAVTMQQLSPVAQVPLVLGGIRTLQVAALRETFCPPHPAPVLACGRGVAALLLARLAGQQARSQVGARLEARGMLPLLPPGLTRAALQDDRLGQRLAARCAAPLNRVVGARALHALEGYALAPPWRHQETTTLPLSGAEEEEARPGAGLVPPRPASGPSTEGREDRKPVRLRLGGSRAGLPLRMGRREGQTSDRPETPRAIEAWGALGLDGGRGLVADRQA